MHTGFVPIIALLLGLLLGLCTGPSSAWAQSTAPLLQWSDCWLPGLAHQVRCGVLRRPLNDEAPQGVQIELHVAVLPAQARQALADPVVFFAGGPGQSALDLAGTISNLLARERNRRDVVLIDQRGTGRSAPLRCDGDSQPPASLASTLSPAAQLRAMQRCLTQLRALPYGDLRYFSTPAAVADAEAVRQALGVERWNLVGISYGTRVALAYLKQFPEHVRRVVLDGVVPPDMALPLAAGPDAEAAWEALLRDCEADAPCQRSFPNLRAQWRQVLASLPRDVVVNHPLTGEPERFSLSREMLASLLRVPLYAPALAAGLPQAIQAAAAGRFTPLVGLAAALGGAGEGASASGMHFSVICSEDAPALERSASPRSERGERGEHWASGLAELYRSVCKTWPRANVPPAFFQPALSAAPVLLLSGALDPVTPPRHAQRMQAALGPQALHRVVPNSGHGQLGLACVGDVVHSFLSASRDADALASAQDDGRCAHKLPRPPALAPLKLLTGAQR